jgi:uncharacterized protein
MPTIWTQAIWTRAIWTRLKARMGDADAQHAVGEALRAVDVAAAVPWYRQAARGGHVGAQTMLAFLLANGIGVRANPRAAVAWYRRAALMGDVGAQNNLGYMLEQGAGAPRDAARAAGWYRLAALQRSATAQVNLALLLLDGRGVERDEAQAVEWLRLAAAQGQPAGQVRLGLCLREGVGVKRDPVEAARWLRAAAEQGNQEALGALAGLTTAEATNAPPCAPTADEPTMMDGAAEEDGERGQSSSDWSDADWPPAWTKGEAVGGRAWVETA